MKVETRRKIAKVFIGAMLGAALLWLILTASGCVSPTIPDTVASRTIAFDGGEQNAGLLKTWPGKGGLLTAIKKAEYDALVELYGRGSAGHPLTPPVMKGRGLTQLRGIDEGFPLHEVVWHIDPQALTDFYLFKEWQRQGRAPL